jgi:hypothetical protein
MRTTWLAAAILGMAGLAGCDSFSANSNVVATSAGRKLETDRLVAMLTSIRAPVTPDAAEVITDIWVNMNLFAQARVNGDMTADSAAVARVMWPQILQSRMQAWQDTLKERRPKPTDASADSAYDAGTAKVFQHIIITPAGTTAADSAAARSKISGVLAQVRKGGDFGALAKMNADASKEDMGYLPVGPRGQFVKEFEEPAWALEPGQVSDVVQSSFGYHLIRRPGKDEARPRFSVWLGTELAKKADSSYVADLAKNNNMKLQANATKFIKDAVGNVDHARKNGQKLATFRGGSFTVADFARWLEALPAGASRQIGNTPDSLLTPFLEGLTQNVLVIRDMDSAKVQVPPANWQALQLAYRATVDQLAAAIGLADSAVSDSTKPKAARLDSAASRVSRFMDQLLAGQAQFRPLPPPLAGHLRESGSYKINRAGLTRAVELASAKWKADSAAEAGKAPAAIQPAPGGPPVGGSDSASKTP